MNIKIESGAKVQITDKPIYNIYGDVVQQKTVQAADEDIKEEKLLHFPLNNTKDEGVRLYEALTQGHYMRGALDSWLFLMGFSDQKPLHINVTKWLSTKEQLRVMLRLLFERLINEKALSVADIKRLTPYCFIDKNGNPIQLAKPKEEFSKEMDMLREIFRPYSDF